MNANGESYIGEWVGGLPDGEGIMIFPNRSRFEGYFREGIPHGFTKVFYSNGNKYEGE